MKLGHSAASAASPAQRAAQSIVALINSRPVSPRPEEIAAIIDGAGIAGATAGPCPRCQALDREYGPIIHQP